MKRILATLLCICLMLSMMVMTAVAEDQAVTFWDGETYTQPSGSGSSEADPYIVSTPAELAWMVNVGGNGKYFKLANDIYVNDVAAENWTETAKPWFVNADNWMSYKNASNYNKTFSGHIDGNGYTVYGIYCDGSVGTVNNALIPIMTGGSIKRLCVSDAVCNSRFSGGIVGTLYGSVTITDCVVKNSTLINTSSTNSDKASGGIAGYASHDGKTSNISGCATFDNTYSTATTQNGGILGNLWKATVIVDSSYTDYKKTYGGTNSTFTPINSCALDGATVDTLKADSYFQNCAKNFIMIDGFDMPVSKGFADVDTNIWNGFYQKPVAGEDGVYLITCPEEFAWTIWSYGGGASYKLTTDIYLNDISVANWANSENLNGWFTGVWNVGYAAKNSGGYFTGTIDGDGHVVYGLYNVNDNKLGGLIPECKATTVKNLGLSSSVIDAKGAGYAGGIIGFINAATVTVDGCFVEKTTIHSGNGFDGAIVGYTQNATNLTVKNCYANIGKHLVDYVHASTSVTMSDCYVIDGTPYPSTQTYGTTTNADVYTNQAFSSEGVTVLGLSEMQGKTAFNKMNGLGLDKWYAIDNGAPMLRSRGTVIGDVSENGIGGETDDVTALRKVIINNTLYSNGDNNRDGQVDICDLVKMITALNVADIEEIIATYGEYCGVEMKLISDKVDALGEEAVNYIFVTDLHFANNSSANDKAVISQMEAIAKLANADDSIDFVVVGGDLTSGGFSTKAGAITANNNVLAPLKACTKPVFVLPGNHDDNSYHVYSGDKVYKPELIISDMDWTTQILAVNSPANIVHDANYENSKYYYYDLPEKKTRVVCLDSIDYRAPFDPETGVVTEMLPADFENNTYFGTATASRQYKSGASYWDYSAEQLRWLTEQALTKEDYNYIFVSHMGIDSDTNQGGETVNAGYRDKLRNIIEAYQSKTTYADGDHTADFTDFSGKILSYSFGHIHVELTTYSEDINLWQICTATANVGSAGIQTADKIGASTINNKSLDWNPFYRALGTDSEACFDVISATPDAIYKFNIGQGADEKMLYSK